MRCQISIKISLVLLLGIAAPVTGADDGEVREVAEKLLVLVSEGNRRLGTADWEGSLKYFNEGIELAERTNNRRLLEAHLRGKGMALLEQHKYREGLESLEKSLKLLREFGDLERELVSLQYAGFAYHGMKDFKGQDEQWSRALKVARRFGDKNLEAEWNKNVGGLKEFLGKDAEALEYWKVSESIRAYLGSNTTELLKKILLIQKRLGQLDEAEVTLEKISKMNEISSILNEPKRAFSKAAAHHNKLEHKKAEDVLLFALKECNPRENLCKSFLLNRLGEMKFAAADFNSSVRYFKQALEVPALSKHVGAATYQNLANAQVGAQQPALESLGQALQIYRSYGDLKAERTVLLQMGNFYGTDHAMALKYSEQALKLQKDVGDRRGQATALRQLAETHDALGHSRKAMTLYHEALRLHIYFNQWQDEARVRIRLSEHYANAGDIKTAHSHLEAALKITPNIEAPNNAFVINKLGIAFYRLGDKEKALSLLINVSVVMEIHLAEGDIEMARPLVLKHFNAIKDTRLGGKFYLLAGRNEDAVEFFETNIRELREPESLFSIIEDYIGLGLAREALEEDERAKSAFVKAVHWLEFHRNTGIKAERHSFFSGGRLYSLTEPYEGLVRISHLNDASKAFFWSESIKARRFLDLAAEKTDPARFKISEGMRREESRILGRMESIRKDIDKAFLGKKPPVPRPWEDAKIVSPQEKGHVRSIQDNEKISLGYSELNRFSTRLRSKYPKYAATRYPQPMSVEHVSLAADEILLAFEVTETETFVFLVKDGKVARTIKVPVRRRDLEAKVRAFRASFESAGDVLAGKFDPKLGKDLYDILLAPALIGMDPKTKLIIIPDEILGILPFDALVMSHPDRNNMTFMRLPNGTKVPTPQGTTYVGDRYDIVYEQSASARTSQRAIQTQKSKGNRMLLVADPIFDESDSRLKGKQNKSEGKRLDRLKEMGAVVRHMGVTGTRTGVGDGHVIANPQNVVFPRLDKTAILASRFRKNTDSLLGAEASEKRLIEKNLYPYKYILIATHGILDESVPYLQEPTLVLSQVGTDEKYDGFLTMSEVMGLDIHADIVALTACKTGLGKRLEGEGVMGFARAFRIAGAKSVLVSLWSVEEEATTIFAENFFLYLRKGETKREALRMARRDVRRQGFDHPFFWAPFVLVGD